MTISPELVFPESSKDALRNLALAQGIMLDFMEGLIEQLHGDDPELMVLWQAAKAMNSSVEVYTE